MRFFNYNRSLDYVIEIFFSFVLGSAQRQPRSKNYVSCYRSNNSQAELGCNENRQEEVEVLMIASSLKPGKLSVPLYR